MVVGSLVAFLANFQDRVVLSAGICILAPIMSGQGQNLVRAARICILQCQSEHLRQPCPKCGCLKQRHPSADSRRLQQQQQRRLRARVATRHLVAKLFSTNFASVGPHPTALCRVPISVPFQLEVYQRPGGRHGSNIAWGIAPLGEP